MTPIKLRLACHLLALQAWLPQPPRQPMKECSSCNTKNEPSRTTCIGCGASI